MLKQISTFLSKQSYSILSQESWPPPYKPSANLIESDECPEFHIGSLFVSAYVVVSTEGNDWI